MPTTAAANDDQLTGPLTVTPQGVSRRDASDRRNTHHFINWRHLGFRGRRKTHRRIGDNSRPLVDLYNGHLMFMVVAIILLSCCDAFFTLLLMSAGAIELNTLMATLIENDTRSFVTYKLALTGLSLILLVIYKDFKCFRWFRVSQIIWVVLGAYMVLIGYELVLLSHAFDI